MAVHMIPRKTKVKIEFLKNFTLSDLIYCLIMVGGAIAIFTSNFDYHIYVGVAWVALGVAFFIQVEDGIRIYGFLGLVFRFFAFRKKFSQKKKRGFADVNAIIPFVGLYNEGFIDFGEYKAGVIEINPMSFGLLNEYKQDMMINTFANALRRLNLQQTGSIVKISKPIVLDDYIFNEEQKLSTLEYMGEHNLFTDEELESRVGVIEERAAQMEYSNSAEKNYKDYFYLVVYDKDSEALDTTITGMLNAMTASVTPIGAKQLFGTELAIFLKATYGKELNEREVKNLLYEDYIKWVRPEDVQFRMGSTLIDGKPYRNFVITDYPLEVGNAWGYMLFGIDRTKVVVNFRPVPKLQSEKQIDKAIMETETKLYRTGKSSTQIELQTHLDTLRGLLASLKNNNEQLFEINTHISCEEAARKEVRAIIRQYGFKYSEMFGRQVDSFISSSISRLDTIKDSYRGIPTTAFAAIFPFISSELQDKGGFYIGDNQYPVYVNLFTRNSERVNSNVMIIGKSGSGKSFATKSLLANLAADNAKVFILDPENEYDELAVSLRGKRMDVGSSVNGIFNPFHISTTLEADEGNRDDSYALHLQFLEEFFKIILEGLNPDAFELLNTLVIECYKSKKIDAKTSINSLKPEDFPIFDDLMKIIKKKIKSEKDAYRLQNYQVIETYIEKFATGGRNSNLWNGPMSIETRENFITFSFQSLLANRNKTIASAQMLLVFKYLDNEIIKNRDFNRKYSFNKKATRKIIVVVDEAHVFINPKYPIALDFMAQMAKRIRKYDGMQIIITQNIKDFVGSEEIARQSTAIINASQYSFIFSLAPNDMTDLVALYRNAGEINEEEQNQIVTAGLGECFLITGPMSRTMLRINTAPYIIRLFDTKHK